MSPQFSPLVQESFLEEEIPESSQGQLPVRRAPSHNELAFLQSYPCLGYGEERSTQPRGPLLLLLLLLSRFSCVQLCDPIDGRQPTKLLHPWDSPGTDTGVGCHFLLQGIPYYPNASNLPRH